MNSPISIISKIIFILFSLFCFQNVIAQAKTDKQEFQYKEALQASQDAIGIMINKHRFIDMDSKGVNTHEFLGKPLIISMVYTSCYQICPMTIRHLANVVDKAKEALGEDSFNVAVIGFDTQFDSPQRMKHFAKQQGIEDKGWYVLSTDEKTIKKLSKDLGFIYFSSPNGFDHVVQATIIDDKGEIYRQVYGETFDTQLLIEPLKDLVLDRPKTHQSFFANMIDKIRFFCTTYDPRTDSYRFDYSLFVGMAIGALIILFTIVFLVREIRYAKRHTRV